MVIPPAIVLAAGASTRMGRAKALLPDREGRPFVVRVVSTLFVAGVRDVIVITGPAHEEISAVLGTWPWPSPPQIVRNVSPERGQLSSLWAGLDAVEARQPDAALMTLVDVPFTTAATVAAVVDAWHRSRPPVVRPACGGRHGHPVLFDAAVFEELRTAPLHEGAKAVIRAHAEDVLNVEVADEGCVTDVDTPEAYRAALARIE